MGPTVYNLKFAQISGQDGYAPAMTDIYYNRKPAAAALKGISAKIDAIMRD
jgi:hypothetical protein